MKISVILTSFNRPKWIRDSLRSIADQTHQDFQLIVVDESDQLDIVGVLKEFSFKDVAVRHLDIKPEERRYTNRLSENCNLGLSLATGDLVCFLADDDYYFPGWFAAASAYFEANIHVAAAFGRLVYSYWEQMIFQKSPEPAQIRFYPDVVSDPSNRLDHNQVIHRRFSPPYEWPVGVCSLAGPDAAYFRAIAKDYLFHPIDANACVKRIHRKSLLESQQIYLGGGMEGLRE